jgi:hypothetical protein
MDERISGWIRKREELRLEESSGTKIGPEGFAHLNLYTLGWKKQTLFIDIEFSRLCGNISSVRSLQDFFDNVTDVVNVDDNTAPPSPFLIHDFEEHFCTLLTKKTDELHTEFGIQNYQLLINEVGNYHCYVTQLIKSLRNNPVLFHLLDIVVELSVRDEALLSELARFEMTKTDAQQAKIQAQKKARILPIDLLFPREPGLEYVCPTSHAHDFFIADLVPRNVWWGVVSTKPILVQTKIYFALCKSLKSALLKNGLHPSLPRHCSHPFLLGSFGNEQVELEEQVVLKAKNETPSKVPIKILRIIFSNLPTMIGN